MLGNLFFCGHPYSRQRTPKWYVLQREWTVCSNLDIILGSIVITTGRVYVILWKDVESSFWTFIIIVFEIAILNLKRQSSWLTSVDWTKAVCNMVQVPTTTIVCGIGSAHNCLYIPRTLAQYIMGVATPCPGRVPTQQEFGQRHLSDTRLGMNLEWTPERHVCIYMLKLSTNHSRLRRLHDQGNVYDHSMSMETFTFDNKWDTHTSSGKAWGGKRQLRARS